MNTFRHQSKAIEEEEWTVSHLQQELEKHNQIISNFEKYLEEYRSYLLTFTDFMILLKTKRTIKKRQFSIESKTLRNST
jgi:hypothetical protein